MLLKRLLYQFLSCILIYFIFILVIIFQLILIQLLLHIKLSFLFLDLKPVGSHSHLLLHLQRIVLRVELLCQLIIQNQSISIRSLPYQIKQQFFNTLIFNEQSVLMNEVVIFTYILLIIFLLLYILIFVLIPYIIL